MGLIKPRRLCFPGGVNAGFASRRQQHLCLALPVTPIAGLCLLIDHGPDFRSIGRDRDFALFIKYSDLGDSPPLSHVVDDPLVLVSSIFDHGVADAQPDGFAEVESFLFRLVNHLLGERLDVEVEEDPFDHHDDDDDAENDLGPETSKTRYRSDPQEELIVAGERTEL